MDINGKMIPQGADIYYDDAFRSILESHMVYLRNHSNTRTAEVDPQRALVYEGDLFGYLLECNIPASLHWVTMRVSGFFGPQEFGPETQEVVIPDSGVLEYLRQAHVATGIVGI